jgi:L-threonylcarbamoyladenylate synthase
MPMITTLLELALRDLRAGKAVAIPTETVYGLAAPIDNESAIRAVFALKNRPLNHPLIVHVAANWDLSPWIETMPNYAAALINHCWPGPLTLVFASRLGQINPLITAGQNSVAIRAPAHPLTIELLHQIQVPLVAPSANPFGKISPTTAKHVEDSFLNHELTILDGGRCTLGIESTIVDVSHPEGYRILRHGLIDAATIKTITRCEPLLGQGSTRVPGILERHYQPEKPLYCFEDYAALSTFCQHRPNEVAVIASQHPEGALAFYPLAQTPEQVAYDLYYLLREADASAAQSIAIELPVQGVKWEGIRERIVKASSPKPY